MSYGEEKLSPAECQKALLRCYVKYTIKEIFQRWNEDHKSANSSFISGMEPLRSFSGGKTHSCDRWVWLQGYVTDISKDCDIFQIADEPVKLQSYISQATSCVLIVNCKRAQKGIDISAKGKYYQGMIRCVDL